MQLLNKKKEMLTLIRKKHKIVLDGQNLDAVPELALTWQSMVRRLNFSKSFLRGIKEGRYARPTPVQMQSIPVIMEGRDAIVLAETGSGKSLAFFVPLLEKLQRGTGLKCLVIAPTRELTIQLYKEFLMFLEQSGRLKTGARVKFMRKALFPNHEGELTKLIRDVEILIGTPLKFAQLTEKFPQEISGLKYIVLDEADKMFEMGF